MQQTATPAKGTFKAGVVASMILHAVIVACLLVTLPPRPPDPEPDQTVNVKMVPEPEKKPVQKRVDDGPMVQKRADKKPDDTVKTPPMQPPALQSASKTGGKTPGGDRPVDPPPMQDARSQREIATPREKSTTSATPPNQADQASVKPAETATTARPPALTLPQTRPTRETTDDAKADATAAPVPEKTPSEIKTPALRRTAEEKKPDDRTPAKKPASQPPALTVPEADALLSQEALSDPRVRQALAKLPPNRRIVQICTIEMLEQIRRARPDALPEGLVPFTGKGGQIAGRMLTAAGGAYVSRSAWYDVSFHCTVDDAVTQVTAFRFAVGAALSNDERKARQLPGE